MAPLAIGHGIHLIATCLLNAPTLRMSVSEIYEWLAERYPSYQYTKRKIRNALRHDSERTSPRFVIANRHRIAGAPIQWGIRPGTEPQLRRLFRDPPPAEPQFPQSYSGLSQQIHCVPCNRNLNRQESLARHQQAHSSHATMSPAIAEALPAGPSAAITSTRLGCTRDHQPLQDELLVIGSTSEVADRDEILQNPEAATSKDDTLRQRLRGGSRRDLSVDSSRNHTFYTRAAIVSARGPVELTRVKIDGSNLHNLLPRSIARKLGFPLHFGSSVRVKIDKRTALTDQYCQFTIRVAGVNAVIDAYVVSELSSLLLGWEWTQQVNLLSDLGNHMYYIPGPHGNLHELPVPGPMAEAEAETECAEAALTREETLPTEEAPTPPGGDERYGNNECEVDDLASVDESPTRDETISDAEFFADAISCQSSDDDLLYIDRSKGARNR